MNLSISKGQATNRVYLVSLLFIAINAVFISQEYYYLSIIPLIFVVFLVAIYSLDRIIYFAVFATPFSVQLSELVEGLEFNLSLPSEPLIIGIMLLFFLKYLYEREFDRNIMRHPVSIAIWINLAWILITSATSTMPLVSFKFLLSRIWFIVAFYLLASQIFRKTGNIQTYIWTYVLSFLLVIGYAWYRHAEFGFFNQQAAHWVVKPFFNDHTSYGAVIAMLLPFLIGSLLTGKDHNLFRKIATWIVLLILLIATVFSYTRAAWVSILGALALFIIIRLRIKFTYLAVFIILAGGALYTQRAAIKVQMEQNKQVSSEDLVEHVKSISNVANDVSNLERLNRWSCAWRMFKEKPFFGWGPGTYMFQYAPFQLERQKTDISTNAATRGNAHSEYIGPLAESGLFGILSFLAIVIVTLVVGIRNWFVIRERNTRILSLSLLLGLVTYYLHGIMNNFLDTDKASVLFWGYTAAIIAISVYHSDSDQLPG